MHTTSRNHTYRILGLAFIIALFSFSTLEANGKQVIKENSSKQLRESAIFFTENIRYLPFSACFEEGERSGEFIKPQEIILHWDGNVSPDTRYWTTGVTYNGMVNPRLNEINGDMFYVGVHFAVGVDGVLQMMEMRDHTVEKSNGAYGYPNVINIEMAGAHFAMVNGTPNVPEAEIENAIDLVLGLMHQYDLHCGNVVGHFQRDTLDRNGNVIEDRGKPDPGPAFMDYFRHRLALKLIDHSCPTSK